MKYRILCKKNIRFKIQYKHKYWPFWFDQHEYGISKIYSSKEEATTNLYYLKLKHELIEARWEIIV